MNMMRFLNRWVMRSVPPSWPRPMIAGGTIGSEARRASTVTCALPCCILNLRGCSAARLALEAQLVEAWRRTLLKLLFTAKEVRDETGVAMTSTGYDHKLYRRRPVSLAA
mmetsp:Transcript_21267/g.59130  ORF Transcript_21267/g.59130 Transcript_21267/m.59130 type:complete len:110 (-) Transcript_21267:10-339(-)